MKSIYMIIITLAVTALAQEPTECSFSTASEDQWCSVALGHMLSFHLPDSSNSSLSLKKDNQYIIFRIKNNELNTQYKKYASNARLFPNGTVTLGQAKKNHSGDYMIEEYDLHGTSVRTSNVHLEIQAPVSKPVLSQVCLSPELMNISCSTEGEEVEIILTLYDVLIVQMSDPCLLPISRKAGKQPLFITTAERNNVVLQNTRNITKLTVSLPSELTGNLKCHVWNNASREETVIHLVSCKGSPSSFPFVTVIVSVLAVLLLVALGCGLIIRQRKQKPSAVSQEENQDEIIYSDVRVAQRRGKTERSQYQF